MPDDAQLIETYLREGSEPAFRELVERHIGLVNSTARRIAGGDTHLAQDVTQQVFADLARKARSLPGGVVLSGWLHRHTYYLACNAVRAERRRRARETTAAEMNSLHDAPSHDEMWRQLSPVLDEALSCLSTEDRDAIVLRYLEQQDLRRIGEILGASENTTHKRITRGLDKLRGFLERRGVTLSTALLATTLDAGAKMTVPAGLASTVSASAFSSAGQTTFFTSLKSMITSKLALIAAGSAAAAAAATIAIVQKPAAAPAAAPAPLVAHIPAPPPAAKPLPAPAPASQPAARVEAPKPVAPATVTEYTGTPPAASEATVYSVQGGGTLTLTKSGTGTVILNNNSWESTGTTGTLNFSTSDGVETGTIIMAAPNQP